MARSNSKNLLLQCKKYIQEEITVLNKKINRYPELLSVLIRNSNSKYQIKIIKNKLKKLRELQREINKFLGLYT